MRKKVHYGSLFNGKCAGRCIEWLRVCLKLGTGVLKVRVSFNSCGINGGVREAEGVATEAGTLTIASARAFEDGGFLVCVLRSLAIFKLGLLQQQGIQIELVTRPELWRARMPIVMCGPSLIGHLV